MIRIGFDDDEKPSRYDDDSDELIHGDGYEELFKKKTSVFIPEHRIEEMKKEFDCVVVRDFGDDYHLSEEERNEKNKFYQAFKKFNRMKKKYRKLDEYVIAMREALQCLDFVAENNGVYSSEEFKKLFLRKKIYISGLEFPKLIGRERKNISWEYLTEFILSNNDPKDILPKKNGDELLSEEDYETQKEILFSEDELKYILESPTDEEEARSHMFFDPEDDTVGDNDNIVVPMSKKDMKLIIKDQPEFMYTIKEMKKARRSMENLSGLAYNLMNEDIEYITQYDRKHNIVSNSDDVPQFKGDMTKGSDYRRYMMELEEWEQENITDDYHGRQKTLGEIQYLELKSMLEENGWNIRAIYGNKEKEKKLARIKEKEKKREKELKKKLLAVQNRRKRRMGEDIDTTSKKKKKKATSKKGKSKKDKSVKKYQRQAEEDINDILLGTAGRLSGDFDDYEKDVLDFSWDNIMNGGDK